MKVTSENSGFSPIGQHREIERRCTEFKASEDSTIEQYLSDTEEPLRSALLTELLIIDVKRRYSADDVPTSQEYLNRFPADCELLDEILEILLQPDMYPQLHHDDDFSPMEQHREIERRCTEFKASEDSTIEQYLSDTEEPLRSALLTELLIIDVKRRYLADDVPTSQEYLNRFPADYALLDETLELLLQPDTHSRFRYLRDHPGRGGMGRIAIMRDEDFGREVAVKEILEDFADDDEGRNRFLKEAEITARLEHPGIVPVYARAEVDGRPQFMMRLIEGEDFKIAVNRFHKNRRFQDQSENELQLRNLLDRFIDVCNTTEYIHSRGIIHRDLKPSNIMLGPYGETLVIDLGLAMPVEDSDDESGKCSSHRMTLQWDISTLAGSCTPNYASPEQAKRHKVGIPSDIFNLGATLYYVLAGRPPYTDEDNKVRNILAKAAAGNFPPPQKIGSKPLQAICLKAMAFAPEERYESASALAEDLKRYLAGERVLAWNEPTRVSCTRWMKRNRGKVVAVGATMLATFIFLVTFLIGRNLAENYFVGVIKQVKVLAKGESFAAASAVTKRSLKSSERFLAPQLLLSELSSLDTGFMFRKKLEQVREEYALAEILATAEIKAVVNKNEATHQVGNNHHLAVEMLSTYSQIFSDINVYPGESTSEDIFEITEEAPTFVRQQIALGLNDWLRLLNRHAPGSSQRDWLVSVFWNIDVPLLQARVREAIIKDNGSELQKLAQEQELTEDKSAALLLAASLVDLRKFDAAVRLLRTIQKRHPNDFWVNHHLAFSLYMNNTSNGAFSSGLIQIGEKVYYEAMAFCESANAVRPGSIANLLLKVNILSKLGRIKEALALCKSVLDKVPENLVVRSNYGLLLNDGGQHDLAIKQLKELVNKSPKDGYHQRNLAKAYLDSGQFALALKTYKRGLSLGAKVPAGLIDYISSLIDLETRLQKILDGDLGAKDHELLLLTKICHTKKKHLSAVRFSKKLITLADPAALADPRAGLYYDAACAAAMAADGQGTEEVQGSKEREELYQQSIDWLTTCLDVWLKMEETHSLYLDRPVILRHWLEDPELTAIREPENLETLPPEIRTKCELLWRKVQGLTH